MHCKWFKLSFSFEKNAIQIEMEGYSKIFAFWDFKIDSQDELLKMGEIVRWSSGSSSAAKLVFTW